MGAFAAGEVVLVPFPFSDLSRSKVRPALVLAEAGMNDWILCQVTSNPYADPLAVRVGAEDFRQGSLLRPSFVRPGKIFTAHDSLIVGRAGLVGAEKLDQVKLRVAQLLQLHG